MATQTRKRPQAQQQEAERYTSVITEIGDIFEAGEYTGMELTFEDGTSGVHWTKDPDKYHDPIQQAFEEGTEVEYSAEQGQRGLKIRVYFPEQEQKPQRRAASNGKASPARKSGVSAKEDKPAPAKKGGVQYVSPKDAYWENKFEYEKEYAATRDHAIQCQEWGKILAPFFTTAQAAGELSLEKAISGLHKAVFHAIKTYAPVADDEQE